LADPGFASPRERTCEAGDWSIENARSATVVGLEQTGEFFVSTPTWHAYRVP
jgi:hypothetical protein